LERLRTITGLSISEVLKLGLRAYEGQALARTRRKPYDIYRELDLGAGSYAIAPAREAKSAVAGILRRKEIAWQVLDFILFIKDRHLRDLRPSATATPDWNVIRIDTRGWRFDRDEDETDAR